MDLFLSFSESLTLYVGGRGIRGVALQNATGNEL